MIYLDSAAAVKLVHAEADSAALRDFLDERSTIEWVSSSLAALDPEAGIRDVDAVGGPVSVEKAGTHPVPVGTPIPEPIRRVVAATYRAFRNRRSLQLLDLQHQAADRAAVGAGAAPAPAGR